MLASSEINAVPQNVPKTPYGEVGRLWGQDKRPATIIQPMGPAASRYCRLLSPQSVTRVYRSQLHQWPA